MIILMFKFTVVLFLVAFNEQINTLQELTEKQTNIQIELSLAFGKISRYKTKISSLKQKLKSWRTHENELQEMLNKISKKKERINEDLKRRESLTKKGQKSADVIPIEIDFVDANMGMGSKNVEKIERMRILGAK